ncbi:Cilia- and flagella-associated protein 20 isoform C [Glycine soja]|uniref:Cilia-and flagella-associated protein 20 isoform C n=1 Tax=Glycine soja TaxID=3848 RepID=A0A445I6T9_GLYSO|nr:Cilia- and flagella-associated protein 20 isoform C [Glycine soja]
MFKNTFQSGFLFILYSLGYGTEKVRAFLFAVTSSAQPLTARHDTTFKSGNACSHQCDMLLITMAGTNNHQFLVVPSQTILSDYGTISMVTSFLYFSTSVVNGHVKRPQDEDIQSNVLEIIGSNIQSTYITCPADPAATLGIKLPFLVLIVKNLKKYFTFEIQVLDDKNVRRRFRASNFQIAEESPKEVRSIMN